MVLNKPINLASMINNPKQAVILCGGRGTRLKPLTDSVPKPMVKINGKPFLHHLMEQLSDEGVKDFCYYRY